MLIIVLELFSALLAPLIRVNYSFRTVLVLRLIHSVLRIIIILRILLLLLLESAFILGAHLRFVHLTLVDLVLAIV